MNAAVESPAAVSPGAAPRSWLYAPGDRPDRCRKALAGAADAVVVDLEDAVAAPRKDEARASLAGLAVDGERFWVRINDPRGPWGAADVDAVRAVRGQVLGIRVPKCEDVGVVRELADELGLPLHVLVESAVGLVRVHELASAHERVVLLSLGEADLAADLRVEPAGLAWARGQVVVASRAAGLASPVQSVWTRVGDLDGLRTSTDDGQRDGFFGRSVIHPAQVEVVNDAFTPTQADVDDARTLLDALAAAEVDGRGVAVVDGRFVDEAVAARARTVVELGRAYGTRPG